MDYVLYIYGPMLAIITAVHALLVWLGWINPTSFAQCFLSLIIGVVIWAVGAMAFIRYQERNL